MKPAEVPADAGMPDELSALVATLHKAEERLLELTRGEVDTVLDREGRPYVLRHAQENLRDNEAAMQLAILNALPADIALLDSDGVIMAVNEAWRKFPGPRALQGPGYAAGINYLEICEQARNGSESAAREVAKGIRAVLGRSREAFSIEYPFDSPTERRWYSLRVVPAGANQRAGAVVMHMDITERKTADEALNLSEARFRGMFTASATGIAISNPQGQFLEANGAYCRMLGYTEEDLRVRDFASLTHPDDLKPNLELRDEILAGARDHLVMEKRYLRKDGGTLWARTSVSAVRATDGAITSMIVIAEDITERKKAETELETLSRKTDRRERLLTTTLSALTDFAYCYDKQGRLLFANQPLLKLWGLALEDVVGKNFFDLGYPEAQAARLQLEIALVFKNKRSLTGETQYTNPAGLEGHYEYIFSPAFGDDGTVDFVVGSTRDITERKRSEGALRESEARFRQLAASIDQVFWLFDPLKKQYLYVSPAYEHIWGRSEANLLANAREWTEAVHPEDLDRVTQNFAKESNGYTHDQIYRVVQPDGTERWVHDRGFPVADEKGIVQRVAGMTVDITEKRRLESQYLRGQRMESIGTMAGGIAHDLNNILAPIMMAVQLLRLEMPEDRRDALLATLESSAQRGAGMVKQVLMFARGVDGERVQLQPKRLLQEIEHIIRETFPRTITIKATTEDDCSALLGDFTQLQQVLLNLCVNARDAMPDGGHLTITASNVEVDSHYAAMNAGGRPGPHVVLQVTDTGTGIPQGIIDKIFDPFFTTKGIGNGTGLGLSTLQAIVKSHGGFVHVYSVMNRGTTFKIHLPSSVHALAEPPLALGATLPRGNGELVLIVDDEEPIRHVTQSTLEAYGYRVLAAKDGAEAVSLFARYSADVALVLTDMMMPIMDGPAAIRVISYLRPDTRFIATSGLSSMRDVSKGAPSVVKYHLQKPFTAENLLKTVRRALKV